MSDINIVGLATSGFLALFAYSLKLNMTAVERRIKSLEDRDATHDAHINSILVTLAASGARQDQLAKRLEETTGALADCTRAVNDLSHKLVEVSTVTRLSY